MKAEPPFPVGLAFEDMHFISCHLGSWHLTFKEKSMIENILDLKNQIVKVDKLNEMTLEGLKIIREEIRLISNKTPHFDTILIDSFKTYRKDIETKIIGFDSLWAHINIAIEKRERLNFTNETGSQTLCKGNIVSRGIKQLLLKLKRTLGM